MEVLEVPDDMQTHLAAIILQIESTNLTVPFGSNTSYIPDGQIRTSVRSTDAKPTCCRGSRLRASVILPCRNACCIQAKFSLT